MAISHSARGPCDTNYLIVGSGGGGGTSAVALVDLRQASDYRQQVVSLWSHSRNGVYSLCVVGDSCLLVGDGLGQLLSYALLGDGGETGGKAAGDVAYSSEKQVLRYAVGASSKGAVRAIQCLAGKVVTAGEDGNVLVLDYAL